MSTRKKTCTKREMITELLEMDAQIIDGSDVFAQAADMLARRGHPKIVCLCGSTRFWKTFQEQSLRLTKEGVIVLSIGCATASDDEHGITTEEKAIFDELHMRKIDLADEILVLNVGGYIGQSTRKEANYA